MPGPRLWSKKQKSNPYAERGLDQFALVSAELQAARDRLVAQLGTQLSLVRFTCESDQGQWIPIIAAHTSSKAEMRALRRVASGLVTGGKHAFDAGNLGDHAVPVTGSLWKHTGSSIGDYNMHEGFGITDNSIAHLGAEASIKSSSIDTKIEVDSNAISKHDNPTGILGYLMMAAQGFLWMFNVTAFGLRIIADLATNAIMSERHTDRVTERTLPSLSTEDEYVTVDRPCADMASSSHTSSQAQPTSIAQRDIKRMMPPLPLHVEPSKTHTQSRFPSTASSPREGQQLKKALAASVSLPKMTYLSGHSLHNDIKENNQAQKTNPNKVVKSSALMVDATTLKISPEKLGQALSGAGIVLVLGGLVMGFIPAVVGVICWWYALPSMRKAVGDKPFVRTHYHHHHGSQKDK